MMNNSRIRSTKVFFVVLLIGLLASFTTVLAEDIVLNNNSGSGNSEWFISGERSLVMNGFDLNSLGISGTVTVRSVSLSVVSPTDQPVDVVIYSDANGGSPSDATLVRRQTTNITSAGNVVIGLESPVEVDQRFLWVGFYLPVDFRFNADTSGSSVLTYWAWSPGTTFDLGNLASASVLGPSDGSAPVNINMQGVARISVEIVTDSRTVIDDTVSDSNSSVPIKQIVGDPNVSLAPMSTYPNCSNVLVDIQDLVVTYKSAVDFYCKIVDRYLKPMQEPDGYRRRGLVYDVYVFGVPSGIQPLPYAVTHCVKPLSQHLNSAVVGVAHGAPRQWEIYPSVRYGEYVCADIDHAGFLSYFIPE